MKRFSLIIIFLLVVIPGNKAHQSSEQKQSPKSPSATPPVLQIQKDLIVSGTPPIIKFPPKKGPVKTI